MTEAACIDLFCGAGGLTHGLLAEGVPVVAGIDVDATCRHAVRGQQWCPVHRAGRIENDIEDLSSLYGGAEFRVLAGCAPCQPFSTYSQRYDTVGTARWALLNRIRAFDRVCAP